MASFLRRFYPKVYITIIMESYYCDVYARVEKAGSVKNEERKRFEIQKYQISEEVRQFIERYERKSPFSYTTLLNPGKKQGAIPSCTYTGHKEDVVLCLGSKKKPWALYSNAQELLDIQHRFKKVGLDFIIAPFALLSELYQSYHTAEARMFALVLEKKIAVCVFQDKVMLFARYYDLEADEDEEIDEFALEEDSAHLALDEEPLEETNKDLDLDLDINIDSLDESPMDDLDAPEDLESLEGLDSLDEIDDLDNLDEEEALTDFQEDDSDEAKEAEAELLEEEQSLEGFSINYKRFETLQTAMHDFYHLSDIESSFIEEIFLTGEVGDCQDLKAYLEDELFVKVETKPIEVHQSLLKLVKEEVKHAL